MSKKNSRNQINFLIAAIALIVILFGVILIVINFTKRIQTTRQIISSSSLAR